MPARPPLISLSTRRAFGGELAQAVARPNPTPKKSVPICEICGLTSVF
jgi:hypothetical protein